MGDNNEQEAADLAAIHNDDDNIVVVVRYLGGRLDNQYNDENPRPPGIPDYNIPADADARLRLIIDASVTKIDNKACYECTTLIEVVFHNKVITIGRSAFEYCSNLQPVELPSGLLRLEYAAFSNCTSLQQIMIPATVHHFGSCNFEDCSSLESVVFVPTTASIELGRYMFIRCYDLRFVTLPQNLRFIRQGCFEDCILLTHLHIPESVQLIERVAFSGSAIQSVTISENVRQIDQYAFDDCAFLERVTIHSTNLNMGNNIFTRCPLLAVIEMSPYLWPTLFASMKGQPDFILQFFRLYHPQIFDVAVKDNDNDNDNNRGCWYCTWWR